MARSVGPLPAPRASHQQRHLDETDASDVERGDVEAARLQAKDILEGERTDADLQLHAERERLKVALAELITVERQDTNSSLLGERMTQLQHVKAAEQAIHGLQVRVSAQSAAIEDAVRARDSFIAMAAHELRTT